MQLPRHSSEQSHHSGQHRDLQHEKSHEQYAIAQQKEIAQGQSRYEPPNQEKRTEQETEGHRLPVLKPNVSIKSRKPVASQPEAANTNGTKNIVVSSASIISEHPHRNEARTLNEASEPVELALTKDDSSEEIIMSPTAYPGQEWTPMHY